MTPPLSTQMNHSFIGAFWRPFPTVSKFFKSFPSRKSVIAVCNILSCNYRLMIFFPTLYKTLNKIIAKRLNPICDEVMMEHFINFIEWVHTHSSSELNFETNNLDWIQIVYKHKHSWFMKEDRKKFPDDNLHYFSLLGYSQINENISSHKATLKSRKLILIHS